MTAAPLGRTGISLAARLRNQWLPQPTRRTGHEAARSRAQERRPAVLCGVCRLRKAACSSRFVWPLPPPILDSFPGQILVKPRAGLSEPEFAARLRVHGARHRLTLQRLNVRVLNLAEGRAEAVLAALRQDSGIEFAERDGIARAAFLPNDPYVLSGNEWHLAKIQAPQAWNLTTGSTNTVVAILDSGINAAHPDLAGRILPGYDFLNNGTDTSDDFGHGTAVAGVVVAAGNNGLGVAGVAYGCSVLPVRVVDASGFASYSSIAQGISYAVDQGARVINISIAGNSPSSTLQDAINYAWSNNVLVVAAAGNNANDAPQYPAACDQVVAVAATAPDDSLATFSQLWQLCGAVRARRQHLDDAARLVEPSSAGGHVVGQSDGRSGGGAGAIPESVAGHTRLFLCWNKMLTTLGPRATTPPLAMAG